MTDSPLGDLSPARFLEEFWQRKPCLIRAACPDFQMTLDGDDLAGLACEELAEARIVTGSLASAKWHLQSGPFEESVFATLGERDWTLLVQDVEKHYPPIQPLLDCFDFLPTWRMDDLMVSFAAPGGSVGPHADQYDVFLLQASGRRSWQIARHYDPALLPDCDLNILANFKPEDEWTLEPGDMLYLPPGVAHHGVALDACLTCSIGFRAPSAADLFLGLGEALAEESDHGGRYSDPGGTPELRPGEVDSRALAMVHRLLEGHLDNQKEFQEFTATYLSRFRLAHEPVPQPDLPAPDEILGRLRGGAELARHPWTRMNWIERQGTALLYAAGVPYTCSLELAQTLCGPGPLKADPDRLDRASLAALLRLLADGQLIIQG